MNIREQVIEFHKAMDLPGVGVGPPRVPPDARVRLRLRLITEEFFELLDASLGSTHGSPSLDVRRNDVFRAIEHEPIAINMPEFADAMADLDYVVEGTRLEFGIDGGPIAAEVHRANMAKVGGPIRADGKRLKPPNWVSPDIAGVLVAQSKAPL